MYLCLSIECVIMHSALVVNCCFCIIVETGLVCVIAKAYCRLAHVIYILIGEDGYSSHYITQPLLKESELAFKQTTLSLFLRFVVRAFSQ